MRIIESGNTAIAILIEQPGLRISESWLMSQEERERIEKEKSTVKEKSLEPVSPALLIIQRVDNKNACVYLQDHDNRNYGPPAEEFLIQNLYKRLTKTEVYSEMLTYFSSLDDESLHEIKEAIKGASYSCWKKWRTTTFTNSAKNKRKDESADPSIHTRDIKKAEELLMDKNILYHILKEQEKLDMVGEDINRGFLTLTAIQALTKRFIDVDGVGKSGSGKSKSQDTVLACMPPEYIVEAMRISKRSPERMHDMLSKAYIFRIKENRGAQASSETFRNSSMDDMGGDVFVVKDGELEHLKMPPISKWGTQLAFEKHEEDDTRGLKYTPDASTDQTRRILNRIGKDSTVSPEFKKALGHTEAVFNPVPIQVAIRKLKKNKDDEIFFLIPYAEKIGQFLDANKVRARRDMKKFIGTIWASATLHQYQRKCISIGEKKFILADIQDIELAFKYSKTQSNMTYFGASPSDNLLIKIIKDIETKWNKASKEPFPGAISDTIIEAVRTHPELGHQKTWTTRQLKYLSEISLITSEYKNTPQVPRYRNYYKALNVEDTSFMKVIDYNILKEENERMKKIYVEDWRVTIEDNFFISTHGSADSWIGELVEQNCLNYEH